MKIIWKNIIFVLKKILDIFMKLLIASTIILWIVTLIKPELIKDFIEWMKNLIDSLWYFNYFIIFISSLIEWFPVLWVVVPGQNILLLVWWFFWKQDINNLYSVIIIASIWAILSNYIWYVLWKFYWITFFKKYWLWFWIWQTEVKYLKTWIKKWWAIWIILWKFHNVARAFVPFIAWSMEMNHKSFIVYNIIWSIVRSITIVVLGVIFAEYYEIIVDYFWYIMTAILVIIWIYIYLYKKEEFMKYLQEKNEEIEALANNKE